MSGTLEIPEKTLKMHFRSLETIIRQAVYENVQTIISPDWGVVPMSVGIVGNGCEIVSRNRGSDGHVAPLIRIGGGIWAWLGFYQEWASGGSARGNPKYSYRSTTLSIHMGFLHARHKPQIFRAEWTAWATWNGTAYSAQAGNAGHPHWQFDALESLRSQKTVDCASTILAVLKQEEKEVEAQPFSPGFVQPSEIDDLVMAKNFSRIHFASVAPWWEDPPKDRHIHSPASVLEIEAWVQKTIKYTREELARL